jgi:hypothetical protein
MSSGSSYAGRIGVLGTPGPFTLFRLGNSRASAAIGAAFVSAISSAREVGSGGSTGSALGMPDRILP